MIAEDEFAPSKQAQLAIEETTMATARSAQYAVRAIMIRRLVLALLLFAGLRAAAKGLGIWT